MGLMNRPYVGTYVPNKRKIIQYTPDALVYLNGDTAMAGCRVCQSRIDIQKFVTSVSVDAGVEAGASSASISLSIPRHYGDSILRDGNTILRNGLEVHIYFRGYFPMVGLATAAEDTGTDLELSEVPQYPYYPVFHGVVTGVSHEYSGGYYSASLTCAGMLHFWQYMQISSSGSFFGSRPENSGVRTNLRGHNLTGMTPYGIIYYLYRDTAGAAAGVGFALRSRTNYRAASSVTGDSLYSMTLRYWENRFSDGMYGLRMHGASGTLFTNAQQAFLSRLNSNQGRILSVASPTAGAGSRRAAGDPFVRVADLINLVETGNNRILRGADLRLLAAANEGDRVGVVVPQMQAFVNDISQYGQVNLFESTYESKLDIATQVTNVCGYEFYQDMDGDLVFKPPLYNLDTSSSRVYRIEPEDIISISFTENEPEATYCIVKGGVFQNLRGAVDEAEWGCRGTYVDYRLVAQFGWRESSIESNYYNNARSAFYAAAANLDRLNKGVNSCSLTIPLRPELRPGYPVYITSIDCFYYVESISHSFSFGSACTTTLNLVARRRKFFPPGRPNVDVESIDLSNTAEAPRSFQYLDNSQQPRLLGFPNVVMALDPTRVNPLFYAVGFLAEEAALLNRRGAARSGVRALREQFLTNMVDLLTTSGGSLGPLLTVASTSSGEEEEDRGSERGGRRGRRGETTGSGPTVSLAPAESDAEQARTRLLSGPWTIRIGEREESAPINSDQLYQALEDLLDLRAASRTRLNDRDGILASIEALEDRVRERALTLNNSTEGDRGATDPEIESLRQQIGNLRREAELIDDFLSNVEEAPPGGDTDPPTLGNFDDFFNQARRWGREDTAAINDDARRERLVLIMFLFRQVRERNPTAANRDMDLDATGTINNTSLLLELIGDRKAAIGLNTPGYYRYYSCSHANPDQQGYVDLPRVDEPVTTTATPTTSTVGGPADEDAIFGAVDPGYADFASSLTNEVTASSESRPEGTGTASTTRGRSSGTSIPTVAPTATETPRPLGLVTSVRNFNNAPEGFPAERQIDFVSLTDAAPVKGLNVRTFVSRTPTPTSSSEIFALSFEQRLARRVGRVTVIRSLNPNTAPAALRSYSRTGGALGNSLSVKLKTAAGAAATSPTTTASALVQAAVSGIVELQGPGGTPIASTDIAAGIPNNNPNPPATTVDATLQTIAGEATEAALRAAAERILTAKGQRLVQQVSQVYQSRLDQAASLIETARNEGVAQDAPRLLGLLSGWSTQIGRLFRGENFNGPVTFAVQRGLSPPQPISQFSPVFPVSDAKGYEHFGTYQYGRGLSIEEGGNYQRLMALDPFQYVDRGLVDRFVRELLLARANRNDDQVQEVLAEVARQLQSSQEPGADILVRRFRETAGSVSGDDTTMIATGMANYIFSDRDAVTKLPVSNAAFLLSDIRPTSRGSDCECRGAEADLMIGALMVGTDTSEFIPVDNQETPDNLAAQWTRAQMILAADGWAAAQAAMRGQADGRRRSSLFDTVQGWTSASEQLVAPFNQLDVGLSNTPGSPLQNQLDRLNQAEQTTVQSFDRAFPNQ
jgi:hypothetical protein